MVQTEPVARSVAASAILGEIVKLGVSHVVNVPDTHQRTLLAELARQSHIKLLTACTEDEAIAINAGLWIGGQRPILCIQHVGLLAAMNNLRGIAMDAHIPTCMLVGYFGRDVSRPAHQNAATAIRIIEPTLQTWGVPYFPMEGPEQLSAVEQAYHTSLERSGPAVVLIGAPTAEG